MFDPSTNFLIAHEWAYGLTEIFHIVSMAVGIGLIAVVDLRVLGAGILPATPQRLLRATMTASMAGLIVAITTGFLSCPPTRFATSTTPRCWLKLMLIVIALVFNYAVHNRLVSGGYSLLTSRWSCSQLARDFGRNRVQRHLLRVHLGDAMSLAETAA